jgi:hypothetical protein
MKQDSNHATLRGDSGQPPKWLRALFVALLAGAVEQIDKARLAEASNRPIDPRLRRDSLQACHWILSDDDDALSFVNVCGVLDLPAERLRPRVAVLREYLQARRHSVPLAVPEPLQPLAPEAGQDDDLPVALDAFDVDAPLGSSMRP